MKICLLDLQYTDLASTLRGQLLGTAHIDVYLL